MENKVLQLFCFVLCFLLAEAERSWWTTDELENHISPEDLREFMKMHNTSENTQTSPGPDIINKYDSDFAASSETEEVDCFGLGDVMRQLPWKFNLKPDPSDKINTHFYFSSRDNPNRVQVWPGSQFGLDWVDFNPSRKTVMIVHGFMSHSNATWILEMTNAFLEWGDVNVITVDWSGGGNTWKYWRAVANTRTVGEDITNFLRQLMDITGVTAKDFHFVGHSLGAHICSYVSYHIGRVKRITGLDPAQPCFRTSDRSEKLDESDAEFVDVIHTNGRLLSKIGFGMPEPMGHADFYPNGGMKQPGCNTGKGKWWLPNFLSPTKLKQAVCSHGRAYLLFTESLIAKNCSFLGHQWNLTLEGVNASLVSGCSRGACSEMGIRAAGGARRPRAAGHYFVLTTEKKPYCPTEWQMKHPEPELLRDLQTGFNLGRTTVAPAFQPPTVPYADPLDEVDTPAPSTKKAGFFRSFLDSITAFFS